MESRLGFSLEQCKHTVQIGNLKELHWSGVGIGVRVGVRVGVKAAVDPWQTLVEIGNFKELHWSGRDRGKGRG